MDFPCVCAQGHAPLALQMRLPGGAPSRWCSSERRSERRASAAASASASSSAGRGSTADTTCGHPASLTLMQAKWIRYMFSDGQECQVVVVCATL